MGGRLPPIRRCLPAPARRRERFASSELAAGTGAATVAAAFGLFRRIMNSALQAGIIGRNPAWGVKAPASGSEGDAVPVG